MPTGYTAGIADGTVTDFPTFALECARAFGALITLRDSPSAEIPDEFHPSEWNRKHVEDAERTLADLKAMTPAQIAAECEAEYQRFAQRHEESAAENAAKLARYDAMIAEVEAWTPPTDDHVEMKKFMLEQLRTSRDFDDFVMPAPKRMAPEVWYADKLAHATRSLSYAQDSWAREVEAANSRTAWVRALRESLGANV